MVFLKSVVLLVALELAHLSVPAFAQSSWVSTIPPAEHVSEAVRICSLAYEIDSINSTAIQFSKTPLKLRWYHETTAGVEAAIIVGTKTKVIYVVFRGTDGEHVDTLIDSQFLRVSLSLPGLAGKNLGTVHEGFQTALRGIVSSLDAALKSAMKAYPGYTVHFVGHSLGGALAHLYGFYAARTFLKTANVRVVTVGQPRVGDVTLMTSVEATKNLAVFRLVYEDGTLRRMIRSRLPQLLFLTLATPVSSDVVARVPFMFITGYSHAGHLLMIRRGRIRAYYLHDGGTSGAGYVGVPDSDWTLTVFDDLESTPEFLAGMVKAFLDHSPWNYNKAMDQAVREGTFPTKFQT